MTPWQMSLKISGERMVKAIEKRTRQLREERTLQLTNQHVQPVQKINGHTTESNVEVIPTSSVPSAKQFDEEKYRTTIITKMKALIAKHKGVTANHGQ